MRKIHKLAERFKSAMDFTDAEEEALKQGDPELLTFEDFMSDQKVRRPHSSFHELEEGKQRLYYEQHKKWLGDWIDIRESQAERDRKLNAYHEAMELVADEARNSLNSYHVGGAMTGPDNQFIEIFRRMKRAIYAGGYEDSKDGQHILKVLDDAMNGMAQAERIRAYPR